MDSKTSAAMLEETFRRLAYQQAAAQLAALADVADTLMPDYRAEFALTIWDEFIDGREPADLGGEPVVGVERSEQAIILAAVAEHIPTADVVKLARSAWADDACSIHATDDVHVAWWPNVDAVVFTRRWPDGSSTILACTPTGVGGRVL